MQQRSHHDGASIGEVSGDCLMGADHGSVNEYLFLELHILSRDGKPVDSGPLSNGILPSDDAALNQRKAFNFGPLHNSGVVDSRAGSNHAVGANDDVGAKLCSWIDLGRWVHKYISSDVVSL